MSLLGLLEKTGHYINFIFGLTNCKFAIRIELLQSMTDFDVKEYKL